MDRITNTDKWKDDWFLNLSAYSKLVFIYLYENCDDAGFYKLNSKFMEKQLGIPAKDIVLSLTELKKGVIINAFVDKTTRRVVWIKNFLFYQKQLPLEKNNIEHKKIIHLLEKNISDFNNHKEMVFILSKIEVATSKNKRTNFVVPTLQEFKTYGENYAIEKNYIIKPSWYEDFYNYYQSKGWKVGKTPMKDWKAAIHNHIGKEHEQNQPKQQQGKMDKLMAANEGITDIKFNK